MKHREECIEKLKAQLDHWNAEMAKLEASARDGEAEARAEFERLKERMREAFEKASSHFRAR